LVVDDEPGLRDVLDITLRRQGYSVTCCADKTSAIKELQASEDPYPLVITDLVMPDGSGMDVLAEARSRSDQTQVIIVTAFSTVESALEAMRHGAYDFVTKPFSPAEIAALANKALEKSNIVAENKRLKAHLASIRPPGDDEFGTAPVMKRVSALISKAAKTRSTVLITGPSGTGKERVAGRLHRLSDRADGPFCVVNCGALPENLMESELFGHERGAFTDARQQKRGLLESADGGSVFLDEIGEMAPGLQSKLLRFLEEKTFKRVGGAQDIQVDVRIIAATNRNLEESVKQGLFREDLYYRLDVLPVRLPPLRERAADISVLAKYYIDLFNREFRKQVQGAAPEVFEALEQYPWPGNVRELRNAIERAMLLADSDLLTLGDFPMLGSLPATSGGMELAAGGTNLEQLERDLVVQALERTQWNQTRAATLLGLNRDQIRYRIEKFGLTRS